MKMLMKGERSRKMTQLIIKKSFIVKAYGAKSHMNNFIGEEEGLVNVTSTSCLSYSSPDLNH
jgi:hypothetical protein